jgi:DDE domain
VLQTGQDKSAVKLNWMASAPSLFRGRHFAPEIIVTCVRWYLRFSLSLRDLEELMAERGLRIDHTTIWRWTQIYGPEAQRRLHGQVRSKRSTWHLDETYIKVRGRWKYLFRAVDSSGATIDFFLSERRDREAARQFLQRALNHPDNPPPHVEYGCNVARKAHRVGDWRQVFVVMKFGDAELDSAYELAIKPAVQRFGFSALRIDEVHDSGSITEQVLKELDSSAAVLADLTGERPNCYFEVGYALAIEKELILTVRKGHTVHFDLADRRFIEGGTPKELQDSLVPRLAWIKEHASRQPSGSSNH